VPGENDFGSFCGNKTVVTEVNLAFTFSTQQVLVSGVQQTMPNSHSSIKFQWHNVHHRP